MTKREMMIKAHNMAKKMVGDYSARLAIALRYLWALAKRLSATTVTCVISGCTVLVNKATRTITGSTYGCKDALRKRFNCSWTGSSWLIPVRNKEAISYGMMDKMDHIIQEFGI